MFGDNHKWLYLKVLDMAEFSKRLCKIMDNRHISQVDLAKKTGLGQSHISKLRRGEREPSLAVLLALAKGLTVSLEELTGLVQFRDIDNSLPKPGEIPEDIAMLAKDILKLSPDGQAAVIQMIRALKAKRQ
jgi:transcriptional regulator with XRE-family HTH domain